VETRLADWIKATPQGDIANDILRACVHCGFCNATCPTYQLLGDELDGPRGRIYQIKQVLEGTPATRSTQLHLDRCLTCRACETTCPSGVDYGHLLDIGRAVVESQVRRPLNERIFHWLLREGLTRRWLFGAALNLGRALRFAMPSALRAKLAPARAPGAWPRRVHARKVLLLNGCTQPAMAPSIDAATARVLDAVGVQALVDARSGCCGAIRHHLHDQHGALENARRNIDAWYPQLQSGAIEAIVINASGCTMMVREYAQLLRRADHIFIEELRRHDLYERTSQAFAVFLPVRSVGVMGDARRYDYVIALRAVETIDFMTAHWAHLPYEFLDTVSRRIVNEVPGISRVVYDISGKPPATIEWE